MPQVKLDYMMGLKLRMFPTHHQAMIMWKNINASRFVYNQLLANSYTDSAIVRNKLDKKYPIPAEYWKRSSRTQKVLKASTVRPTKLARITTKRYPWLADEDLDSDMISNTLLHYNAAWKMYHKVHNVGVPKFKRKSQSVQSYSTSNHYNANAVKKNGGVPSLYNGSIKFVDCNHITLPKLGKVKVKLHRALPQNRLIRIATVTIKHVASDEWFVSLLLKSDEPFNAKAPKTNKQIGIDLNTENFLTDSDGKAVANPRYYRTIKKQLAKQQRILARRLRRAKKEHRNLRNCKNYQKQRLVVARLHQKVSNQRNNFLQQLSTTLIKNHDLVVAKCLKSKNLLKNHALAMSIADVGWRSFLTMLEYKANKYGHVFVEVNPAYTTQTCSHCGFRMGTQNTNKLTLSDRTWTCPCCHTFHIRDHNAAKNILHKGKIELRRPLTENSPVFGIPR